MRIRVFLGKDGERILDIQKGRSIESILKSLKINPQTVIVSRNGEIVAEQEILNEKDTLRIIKVK